MKKITLEEARVINGGRWKCKICNNKKKYWLIGALAHMGECGMLEPGNLGFFDCYKFCL